MWRLTPVCATAGVEATNLAQVDAVGESARAELRAKYLNASMADGKGGSKTTAVRHWLRYCVFGRRVSPMRHLNADSPHPQKLAEEALLMDFAIWLAVTRPPSGGRGRPSVETIVKYISTIKAWHYRQFGYRIGADLELTRLRDLLKGIRREHMQPASRRRYMGCVHQIAGGMRHASLVVSAGGDQGWQLAHRARARGCGPPSLGAADEADFLVTADCRRVFL